MGISSILLSGEYNTLDYSFLGDSDFDIAIHNSFYLYYSGLYGNPSKNLEASITSGSYSLYYEYDLDEEGYPKKIYCTELDNGMPISSTESEEAFTASIEYWKIKIFTLEQDTSLNLSNGEIQKRILFLYMV